jgi:aspartate racemase
MKTIGLLGGMSWESTLTYYAELNKGVRERLGGLHSASVLLASLDFDAIEKMQGRGDWLDAGDHLAWHAQRLEDAGAGCILIASNTMHKVYPVVADAVTIPVLHIADAVADAAAGLTVALLGTKYTMEHVFYRRRLEERGLTVLIPGEEDREMINRVIYDELCLGLIRGDSRQEYSGAISRLAGRGADAVVLGCTEIGLLVRQEDSCLPLLDTTLLHVKAALDWALR